MKQLLRSIFGVKKLANFLSKDWLLRFISLSLAVLLWVFVGGEERVDKNVMVPVEIINLPRDLVISNQFKKEIEVTVSGPRSLILEMSQKMVTRQVDLSAATPGSMVIENTNKHIPVSRGITVQRVQPSSIILSLDKLIQRQYPVSARTVGIVANGYYIKSLKTEPAAITITGPQTTLSQFEELYTKAINLTGVKQSAQLQVPLELEPAIVELIGETSVTADLSIDLKTETRSMKAMKVHVSIDGLVRQVEPSTVRVTANIPKLLLQNGADPQSLLSVTAIQQDDDETMKISVIPKADVEFPIEVLSIIPQTVRLVDENPTPVYENSDLNQENSAAKIPAIVVNEVGAKIELSEIKNNELTVIKSNKKKKIIEK